MPVQTVTVSCSKHNKGARGTGDTWVTLALAAVDDTAPGRNLQVIGETAFRPKLIRTYFQVCFFCAPSCSLSQTTLLAGFSLRPLIRSVYNKQAHCGRVARLPLTGGSSKFQRLQAMFEAAVLAIGQDDLHKILHIGSGWYGQVWGKLWTATNSPNFQKLHPRAVSIQKYMIPS